MTHRLRDTATAHDLAQETFLRLLRVEQAELIRAPQAYLFRIASNLVYERQLRVRREVVTFDSRLLSAAAERIPDPGAPDPGEQLALRQCVEGMIGQLPPLYASIVVLKKRDGKSFEEIARELNISVHTCKKYLTTAIARCRALARGGK